MKRAYPILVSLSIFTLIAIYSFPNSLTAKPMSQMGDVSFTDTKKNKTQETYPQMQSRIIGQFDSYLTSAKSGASPEYFSLSLKDIRYLTGAYLVCSLKRGKCPEILDALLDIETFEYIRDGNKGCKNMVSFWRSWISNDMDRRHDMFNKTAFINVKTQFNTTQRPKYVRCKKTSLQRAKSTSRASFLKNISSKQGALTKTVKLLKEIEKNVDNVLKESSYR